MNIGHGVRNSIYRTGRIALRLRLNRARLTTIRDYLVRLSILRVIKV
jgi:hypothetical protein